jgi:hypothetical protein
MNLSDDFPAIFRTGIPWKTVDFPFSGPPPIGRPERKTIHCREWKLNDY